MCDMSEPTDNAAGLEISQGQRRRRGARGAGDLTAAQIAEAVGERSAPPIGYCRR